MQLLIKLYTGTPSGTKRKINQKKQGNNNEKITAKINILHLLKNQNKKGLLKSSPEKTGAKFAPVFSGSFNQYLHLQKKYAFFKNSKVDINGHNVL